MKKIAPFIWFDDQAEEAANFYVSIFKNSRIGKTNRYNEKSSQVSEKKSGSVMVVEFEIEGQKFTAINGGPYFKFTPAISFMVDCDNQEEVDNLWKKLSKDGEESQCGWLTDKYGLSWQIIPSILSKMMNDPDDEKSNRVTEAMLKMKKIDIEKLKKAYKGNTKLN